MKLKTIERDADGKLPAFGWPGGYPLVYMDKHGSCMCSDCATKSLQSEYGDDFVATDVDVLWEGPPVICEDCNKEIKSAYGEPESN